LFWANNSIDLICAHPPYINITNIRKQPQGTYRISMWMSFCWSAGYIEKKFSGAEKRPLPQKYY